MAGPDFYTPAQQAFIAARILQAKREVLHGVIFGSIISSRHERLPLTVRDFSTLHEYCDANELGGLCDDRPGGVVEQAERLFPGAESHDSDSEWVQACNAIQHAVGQWLESRAMVDDAALIAKLLLQEQAQCLLDDERRQEAEEMLMDLRWRVGAGHGFTDEACDRLLGLVAAPERKLA